VRDGPASDGEVAMPEISADDQQMLEWLQRCLATDPEAGVLVSVVGSEDEGDAISVAPYTRLVNMGPLSLLFVMRDLVRHLRSIADDFPGLDERLIDLELAVSKALPSDTTDETP
jgi:hypothetical protein